MNTQPEKDLHDLVQEIKDFNDTQESQRVVNFLSKGMTLYVFFLAGLAILMLIYLSFR